MDYDWLPASDGQLILWFKHFRDGCETYSGSLDLTAEDLMQVDADYKALAYMLDEIQALRAELQTRIDFKNVLRDGPEGSTLVQYPKGIILAEHPVAVRTGILPRLIRFVTKIKEAKGYNGEIGRELGIEPLGVERIPSAPEHIVPVLVDGMVRLDFTKSLWQGVMIESQRGNEAQGSQWELLGTVFESPFVDARPLLEPAIAEARRYRLRYVDAANECGAYSQVVQVIVPAHANVGTPAFVR